MEANGERRRLRIEGNSVRVTNDYISLYVTKGISNAGNAPASLNNVRQTRGGARTTM